MEHIYERAEELGIKIYPYQRNRYEQTKGEHIIPDVSGMSRKDFVDYLDALYRVHSENAGGHDGWSGAFEILERLGFQKKEARQGHRVFVSMFYDPLAIPEPAKP